MATTGGLRMLLCHGVSFAWNHPRACGLIP